MSSLYLTLRTSAATTGRALRFERGRPIAEFSLGRRGTWQTSAAGVADRHVWISFDGQCIVLRRDAESPPVSVDGLPLALRAEPIVRLPCRIELGTARLIADDQAPPRPALEAGALVRGVVASADSENILPRAFASAPVAKQCLASGAGRAGSVPRVGAGGLVTAEGERTLGDGHATSVMPLDVMLQRGLIPTARPREPQGAPQRRRRPLAPKHDAKAIGARAAARISRWLSALELERWLSAGLGRRRAWAMLVPLVPLLSYALQPESPGGAAPSASFETTAWAASHAARPASEARRPARLAPAAPSPPAEPSVGVEKPSLGADAPSPAIDTRAGPTGERLAVDALAAGDTTRARALYAALAHGARDNVAFAEAARILSMGRSLAQAAQGREPGRAEERGPKDVTTRSR
jgi:hypothetical protein